MCTWFHLATSTSLAIFKGGADGGGGGGEGGGENKDYYISWSVLCDQIVTKIPFRLFQSYGRNIKLYSLTTSLCLQAVSTVCMLDP